MKIFTDIDCHNKRVLIREDFNVPMKQGKICDDSRLRAALPTIQYALRQQATIILISHLGRPKPNNIDPEFSLAPVANALQQLLNQPVRFQQHWIDGMNTEPGTITLCENLRFLPGETENDQTLAKKMAALCDIYVMDAFATAHRAHASTVGVAKYAPLACAGPLFLQEITALQQAIEHPKHPIVAIVGGAKISTKLTLLKKLLNKVDYLITGGGIANTLLAAQGFTIGTSLVETSLIPEAQQLLKLAKPDQLPLPSDVIIAKAIAADAKAQEKIVTAIDDDDKIVDIGKATQQKYTAIINQAKTIIWNGPIGVFEYEAFASGTQAIAQAIANSNAYSLAGGGDTIAAIHQFNITDQISYISTGGGAFLAFLQGDDLPALSVLQQN